MVFIFTSVLIFCLKFSSFTSQLLKETLDNTNDLSNTVIRASIGEFLNHSGNFEQYIQDSRTRHEDGLSKFNYGLFMLLREIHNFSYKIILINDDKNNEIINIVQSFDYSETEISIHGALQTVSNIELVTFLMPFGHLRMCFFFKVQHSSILSFSKPFSKRTWWTIVVYSLIILLFLKVSFLLTASEESSWSFSILVVLATLFQQDLSYFPPGVSSRIVFLSLLIMSLLLFNYYTSIMVSLLLNAEPYAFKTVDELVKSNLEIAIENQSYTRKWLETANGNDIREIVKKISPSGNLNQIKTYPLDEGILKMKTGELIYHADTVVGYEKIGKTFTQDVICDISDVQMVPSVPVGMVLPKNSQFFEPFQRSLLRLREIGLVHRLQKIWIAEEPPCFVNPSIIAPVGIENVGVAFVYFIIGLLLAVLFLLHELR